MGWGEKEEADAGQQAAGSICLLLGCTASIRSATLPTFLGIFKQLVRLVRAPEFKVGVERNHEVLVKGRVWTSATHRHRDA